MGERSAVRPKSGKSVRQSDPALRRPTSPSTAGRKPAARPPVQISPATDIQFHSTSREAGTSQRKTVRGTGQSPDNQAQREALGSFTSTTQSHSSISYVLDDSQIKTLIEVFQTLDRWDKEAHGPQIM
jgi:hypothetical protein